MPPKIVLLISLGSDGLSVDKNFISDFKLRAPVKEATNVFEAEKMLADLRPHAVCFTHRSILNMTFGLLLKLVDYTKRGGRVVLCASALPFFEEEAADSLFGLWGLDWTLGARATARMTLYPSCHLEMISHLPQEYFGRGWFLEGVGNTEKVYTAYPDFRARHSIFHHRLGCSKTFAAYTPVGDGFFGYKGDTYFGKDTGKIVLAMCDL